MRRADFLDREAMIRASRKVSKRLQNFWLKKSKWPAWARWRHRRAIYFGNQYEEEA